MELLRTGDKYLQVTAIGTLGRLGAVEAVPEITGVLKTGDYYLQQAAVQALGELRVVDAVPKIIGLLKGGDWDLQQTAARALGNLMAVEAVPEIMELLRTGKRDLQEMAIHTLAELRAVKAVPEIMKFLSGGDRELQKETIRTLGTLDAVEAVPEIMELLRTGDSYLQMTAIENLGKLRAVEAVPEIIELLKIADQSEKERVADVLAELRPVAAIPEIMALLKSGDRDSQKAAISILGSLQSVEAVPEIMKFLRTGDSYLQQEAIHALGNIQAVEAVPDIVDLLFDNKRLFEPSIETLGKLRVIEAVPDIIKLLRTGNSYLQMTAIKAFGELRVVDAIPEMMDSLRTGDSYLQQTAAQALGKLGAVEAIPEIIELLKSDNQFGRVSAIQALGELQAVEAMPEIKRMLRTGNQDVQQVAAVALAQIVHSSAYAGQEDRYREWQEQQLKEVREKIFSGNPFETEKSIRILTGIFTEQSVELLWRVVQNGDRLLKKSAVNSIGVIGKFRPSVVEKKVPKLLTLFNESGFYLREVIITSLGRLISFSGKEQAAAFRKLDQEIQKKLQAIVVDAQKNTYIRYAAIDALGATGREESGKAIYDLLSKLEKKNKVNDSLRNRCLSWLGWMEYAPAQGYAKNELKDLEQEKALWRKQRDSEEQKETFSGTKISKEDQVWRKEHWEYLLGSTIARIEPETTGIDLLNHPLYQVRQGAIRALAAKANATLIGKIIQAHQNFDPDDLPSPFPYAAFQAIDLALWNLEYSGKKEDVSKLQEILKTLKPCQVPGQEGAIRERLEWTIQRLEEKNAELAAE